MPVQQSFQEPWQVWRLLVLKFEAAFKTFFFFVGMSQSLLVWASRWLLIVVGQWPFFFLDMGLLFFFVFTGHGRSHFFGPARSDPWIAAIIWRRLTKREIQSNELECNVTRMRASWHWLGTVGLCRLVLGVTYRWFLLSFFFVDRLTLF